MPLMLILLGLGVWTGRVEARRLIVPIQYASIQSAINSANQGDTVLVLPGRYRENVDYGGRQVVVGSLLLTTGDPAYIDSTIIDGDSTDCCVAFNNGEGPRAVLRGFTLTRGVQNFGGGIDVQTNAAPVLQDLVITGNWAYQIGAGIYCTWNSRPRIERVVIYGNSARQGAGIGSAHEAHPRVVDCVIRDNTAEAEGGGVFCGHGNGEITLERTLLTGNRAGTGGAIYFETSRHNELINVTLSDNAAQTTGGVHVYGSFAMGSDLVINSTVIYGNSLPELTAEHGGGGDSSIVSIRYSDIRFGRDSLLVTGNARVRWDGTDTGADPQFADPDQGDFRLTTFSPCIDAGDPELPYDSDSTRADMGALPFLERGVLIGWVRDARSDTALSGATVTTGYGESATTDSAGFWMMRRARAGFYDLVAAFPGYGPDTSQAQELETGDTLQVDFSLDHADFALNRDRVEASVDSLQPVSQTGLEVANAGRFPLRWAVVPHNRGESGVEPWQLRRSLAVATEGELGEPLAAAFGEDLFCVMTHHPDGDRLALFDRNLNLTATVDWAGEPLSGNVDMDWGGGRFWAVYGRWIVAFNADGRLLESLETGENLRGIAWEPNGEFVYLASVAQGISRCDANFGVLNTYNVPTARVTGLAFFEADPDSMPLLVFHSANDSTAAVSRLDFGSETLSPVWMADYPSQPKSIAVTDDYDVFNGWVSALVVEVGDSVKLEVRHLKEQTWWITVNPVEGQVEPQAQQAITLTFTALSLRGRLIPPGIYDGELRFQHSAPGFEFVLPVTMTVREVNSTGSEEVHLSDFGLGNIAPNPFNTNFTLEYRLPEGMVGELKVFDLAGRVVAVREGLRAGAGSGRVTINASELPSGVYIARMSAGGNTQARKVVCLK